MSTDFEDIYLGLNPAPGKLRLAANGIGWKQNEGGDKPTTIPASDMKYGTWQRVARNFQLRLELVKDKRITFDGFARDDFEHVVNLFKNNYNVTIEPKDISLRGWNWGKAELQGPDLSFVIAGKPAFTVPISHIHNSNINKTEVGLEFQRPEAAQTGAGGTQSKKIKSLGDELTEMRLYIPGSEASARRRARKAAKEANMQVDDEKVKKSESDEDEEQYGESGDEEAEDQAAAQVFYETVKERAELGQVQGDAIVTFSEVHCATPRGRYDVELYNGFLRLRNKSYDYKILYTSIKRIFLLPRNDEINIQLVISVDPPIRQGQTRYPYLVLQFAKEEVMEADLNLEEENVKTEYPDLKEKYEDSAYTVVSSVLKAVSHTKIITPSGAFSSHSDQQAVKCNYRTNEGFIYILDKYILFVSKQPMLIPYSDIKVVRFERVANAMSSVRTFDLKIELKTDQSDVTFSAIQREEHPHLSDFLTDKKLKVKNEILDEMVGTQQAVTAALMEEESDDDSDGGDRNDIRGSAGEDEDSEVDEDFQGDDSASDVAEEFDENYSSDSGSDAEEEEAPAKKNKASDEGSDAPPKKKKKTSDA